MPRSPSDNNLAGQASPPVVGLLLLYYEPYSAMAIRRFAAILQAISLHNRLVVILNQPVPLAFIPHPDVRVIAGDNTLREFSGWDTGLQHCRQNGLLPQEGIVLFANDTFCHHNKFGPLTRLLFIRAFKRLLDQRHALAMAGEVHGDLVSYILAGKGFSSWISTYLFGLTMPLVNQMDSLAPKFDLNVFFNPAATEEQFFAGPMNQALQQKLCAWLFGHRGNAKWYAAQALSPANLGAVMGKAKSVLCELHLSAAVISMGGRFISVFSSPALRQLRRLERLFHG